MYDKNALAGSSTGNNTHASLHVGGGYEAIVIQFVVDVAGATPTVTWKAQGSAEGTDVTDANSNWYDIGYVTDATDTVSQATRTRTAVGADIAFVSNPVARRYRKFRLVTTANTNVTYHADIFRVASGG